MDWHRTISVDHTNTKLFFVVTGHNCGPHVAACLDSLLDQESSDWRCIVVDDSSVDDTLNVLSTYRGLNPDKFELIVNPRRLFKAEAFRIALERVPEDSIVAELDLDDSLCDPGAVDDILSLHRFFDVVWTQHQTVNHTAYEWGTWKSTPLPRHWSRATAPGDRVWNEAFFPGHMRTFKRYLFAPILEQTLRFNGQPLRVAFDMAYYTAILESLPYRFRCFYDKTLYTYNIWNHNDEFRERRIARAGTTARRPEWCQSEMDKWFKTLPRRERIDVNREYGRDDQRTTVIHRRRARRSSLPRQDAEMRFVFRTPSAVESEAVLKRCIGDTRVLTALAQSNGVLARTAGLDLRCAGSGQAIRPR